MIETTIKLNRPYINVKMVTDYKYISPDGFVAINRLRQTKPMQQLLVHAGIKCETIEHRREVDGYNAEIRGIPILIQSPKEISFISNDAGEAKRKYLEILKPALLEYGYIIEGHKCLQTSPCLE